MKIRTNTPTFGLRYDKARLDGASESSARRVAAIAVVHEYVQKQGHVALHCELSVECPRCGLSGAIFEKDGQWYANGRLMREACTRSV